MKLSYLMPTYNKEPYIAEAINSFLAQKYSNKELIVIDDCSKDGTKDVVEFYTNKHKNIRYFRTTKNMGVAFCRNLARANASGEVMCVLDADDISYPKRSEIVYKYFRKNKDVDVIYGGAHIIDVTGKRLGDVVPDAFSMDKIKRANYITHSTLAYRKSVKTLYRNDLRFIDDWYFYIDCYNDGYRFGYVGDVLSAWRISPDGLTYLNGMNAPGKEKLKDRLRAEFNEYDDDLSERMKVPQQRERIKAILNEVSGNSKVLDVGCNGGYLMEALRKKHCEVMGIEIAPNLVSICEQKGLKVSQIDANEVHRLPQSFDRIIYGDILEHYDRQDMAVILNSGVDALKVHGKLIITVPHKNNVYSTVFNTSHKANYDARDIKDILPNMIVGTKPIYHGDIAVPLWNLITVKQ